MGAVNPTGGHKSKYDFVLRSPSLLLQPGRVGALNWNHLDEFCLFDILFLAVHYYFKLTLIPVYDYEI